MENPGCKIFSTKSKILYETTQVMKGHVKRLFIKVQIKIMNHTFSLMA